MAKDLVCGMTVKEDEAAGFSIYNGKKYYFCSLNCIRSWVIRINPLNEDE